MDMNDFLVSEAMVESRAVVSLTRSERAFRRRSYRTPLEDAFRTLLRARLQRTFLEYALRMFHIEGVNMMCAFGVPGNMIHGAPPGSGFSLSPVVAPVAYGM